MRRGRAVAGGGRAVEVAPERLGRVPLRAAAVDAVEVLVPRLSTLDAVVHGGDQRALDTVRADSRLAGVFALARPRVLDDAAERARAAEIVVRES